MNHQCGTLPAPVPLPVPPIPHTPLLGLVIAFIACVNSVRSLNVSLPKPAWSKSFPLAQSEVPLGPERPPFTRGTAKILPLNTMVGQAYAGRLARFGYSLMASPARYGVRSAHWLSRNSGSLCMVLA